LLLVLWAGNDLAYVSIGAEADYTAPADVILVLGCNVYSPEGGPSVCIRARAGHAADLYKQGFAPYVIPSGGPTAQGPTEAAVMTRVLEDQGVPAAAIVPEEQAHNTIQNILYSQAIMRAHGWHSAILVSEPVHINRAALIARDAGLPVFPSPALDSANWQQPGLRLYNLGKDTVSLMLYQLKTLTGTKQ
jgi:vancomycin permeability regulator SanA